MLNPSMMDTPPLRPSGSPPTEPDGCRDSARISPVPRVNPAGQMHEALRKAIEHAVEWLPSQWPITAFVHHNPLHCLEDRPFSAAVIEGAKRYGYEPYWTLTRYRMELEQGRIEIDDLRGLLTSELGAEGSRVLGRLGTVLMIRLAMLLSPLQSIPGAEAEWIIAQSDLLQRFLPHLDRLQAQWMIDETRGWLSRDPQARELVEQWGLLPPGKDLQEALGGFSFQQWEGFTLRALWEMCQAGVRQAGVRKAGVRKQPQIALGTIRSAPQASALHQQLGEDTDRLVHEVLIRLCSLFLDQGLAAAPLPQRQRGFYASFIELYGTRFSPLPSWLRGLPAVLAEHRNLPPLESMQRSLQTLGVCSPEKVDEFIIGRALALRGFAGMLWQLESRTPWARLPVPAGTLEEFLAVRLMLDTLAASWCRSHPAATPGKQGSRSGSSVAAQVQSERALRRQVTGLFQLAQLRQWSLQDLSELSPAGWGELLEQLEQFPEIEQRRVFHEAYEQRFLRQALDAIMVHAPRRIAITDREGQAKYQVVCCIDDREESFRRHLEEVDPSCETLGAAGFFGVAMYYQGASHAHYRPLCPAVVTPRHFVREEPVFSAVDLNRRRLERRRFLGRLTHGIHSGSRTMSGGVVTGIFGSLASFPLVARVLAPGITSRIRESLGGLLRPPATELHLHRTGPQPGSEEEALGFSLTEMAEIVARLLADTGLAKRLSPLVIIFGHGSSSLNNPHESAYSCGACSGGRGGPNARAFATMANDPRVRELVAARGISIPSQTWFVGGYHNTCNDRLEYFDLDRVPVEHRSLFREVEAKLAEARTRNAHERARRFQTVPLDLSIPETLPIVEQRAEDLSEARPEYNHATHALCFVGNRWWHRGLFLDRRAFLASYDPALDDQERTILTRILQAVIPVCAGISLEYLFSTIDPEGYGCGSKLPHNIVSLLGVMTGAASDLRPGLSAQMVEIHEPMRILFVIETTTAAMEAILAKNPAIDRLVRGHWVRIAVIDPEVPAVHLHNGSEFVRTAVHDEGLATARSSHAWYRGNRESLPFATIRSDEARPAGDEVTVP